ncbi:DUF3130 family protein [Enterococcus rivorum]|uniref:DUF3130 family protein n=1 Tax=Enterococcus rivorum TaxID=762845 RepID=UPI001AE8CC5B|nr:DUF3130 family protein [Enterococcus rivorum]MBP2100475.1 type VII secretion effector (TIGR04197 family) [Enterococcus rivorum]
MAKISTDEATVNDLTSQFSTSLSSLKFEPKQGGKMSYSESSAASGMKSSLASLGSILSSFKSNASKDIGNLSKIHQAIKQSEKNAIK